MKTKTLADLYQYFDQLVDGEIEYQAQAQEPLIELADVLFASSYIRGFVALEAVNFGDEQQLLSVTLADKVSDKLAEAKNELTPQDQQIVSNFWHTLKRQFAAVIDIT